MIVNNEYGTYSVPNEITYTYTAQAIINGDVHEKTTIEYIKSINKIMKKLIIKSNQWYESLPDMKGFIFYLSLIFIPYVILMLTLPKPYYLVEKYFV